MNRFERRAERGAAFLTEVTGGEDWVEKITQPIDLASSRRCVLGQVFSRGSRYLTGFEYACYSFYPMPFKKMGFIARCGGLKRQEQAWERLIARMRKEREQVKYDWALAELQLAERDMSHRELVAR